MKQQLLTPLPHSAQFEVKRSFREIFDASREYLYLRVTFIWLCVKFFVIPVAAIASFLRVKSGDLYDTDIKYEDFSTFNEAESFSFLFLYVGGLLISLMVSSLIVNADQTFTQKKFRLGLYAKIVAQAFLKLFLILLFLSFLGLLLYGLTTVRRALGLSISALMAIFITPVLYLFVAFWLSRKWEKPAVLFTAIGRFANPLEWFRGVIIIGICVSVYMYATGVTEVARAVLEYLLRQFSSGGVFIVAATMVAFAFNFFSYTVNLVLGVVLSMPIVYHSYSAYAEDHEHFLVSYLFSNEKLEGRL